MNESDRITEGTPDVDQVISALLLTDFEEVDDMAVQAWTEEERIVAFEWAMREHLGASDNDDVPSIPEPACVQSLRRQQGMAAEREPKQ